MPVGMDKRPRPLPHGRIKGLHAYIKPQEEIVEVKTESETIGRRKLLIELIKPEYTTRLIRI